MPYDMARMQPRSIKYAMVLTVKSLKISMSYHTPKDLTEQRNTGVNVTQRACQWLFGFKVNVVRYGDSKMVQCMIHPSRKLVGVNGQNSNGSHAV